MSRCKTANEHLKKYNYHLREINTESSIIHVRARFIPEIYIQ